MFTTQLRVRWSEVDMQKVVFNGNYLNYFDIAFTEFWRTTELPSVVDQQHDGHELFVKKATVEYLSAARFDDVLYLSVAPIKFGTTSMVFEVKVWKQTTDAAVVPVAQGQLVYVYVKTQTMRACPLPPHWVNTLQKTAAQA